MFFLNFRISGIVFLPIQVKSESDQLVWVRKILDKLTMKQQTVLHFRELDEWRKPLACQMLGSIKDGCNCFCFAAIALSLVRNVPICSSRACCSVPGGSLRAVSQSLAAIFSRFCIFVSTAFRYAPRKTLTP
jgi:hypothetical protein